MVQVLDNLPGATYVMLQVIDNLLRGYICYGTSLRQSTGGLHMLWDKS